MQNVITIENGVTRHPLYRMKEPVNLQIAAGEHVAIVGPNGGGKSLLVDTITIISSTSLSVTRTGMPTGTIITSSAGIRKIWTIRLSWPICFLPARTNNYEKHCTICLALRRCSANILFCCRAESSASFS